MTRHWRPTFGAAHALARSIRTSYFAAATRVSEHPGGGYTVEHHTRERIVQKGSTLLVIRERDTLGKLAKRAGSGMHWTALAKHLGVKKNSDLPPAGTQIRVPNGSTSFAYLGRKRLQPHPQQVVILGETVDLSKPTRRRV